MKSAYVKKAKLVKQNETSVLLIFSHAVELVWVTKYQAQIF